MTTTTNELGLTSLPVVAVEYAVQQSVQRPAAIYALAYPRLITPPPLGCQHDGIKCDKNRTPHPSPAKVHKHCLSFQAVKYNQRTVRRAHIKSEPLSRQPCLNSLRAIYVRGISYEGDDRPTQNTRKLSTLPCFDWRKEERDRFLGGLFLPQYISNPDRSWHACYATSKHVSATHATLI